MGRLFNQITSLDNLFQAWDEVAENKGAPGIDVLPDGTIWVLLSPPDGERPVDQRNEIVL